MAPKSFQDFVKNTGRITLYGVWFGLVLWVSCIGTLTVTNRIIRVIHVKWSHAPSVRLAVALGLWLGFAFVLAWLPVWWMKRRRSQAMRLIARCATFLISMLLCTLVCTALWQNLISGKLYSCADGGWLDYLSPGDWVHGTEYRPLAIVHQITTGRSMSDPDEIKEGWSITRLWLLWWAWLSASVIVSASLSFWFWRGGRNTNTQGMKPRVMVHSCPAK